MSPRKDPKLAACRQEKHTPSPNDLALDGDDVTTSCSVCGALLTSEHLEWYGVFDDSSCCDACEEGAPFCSCDGGPVHKEA